MTLLGTLGRTVVNLCLCCAEKVFLRGNMFPHLWLVHPLLFSSYLILIMGFMYILYYVLLVSNEKYLVQKKPQLGSNVKAFNDCFNMQHILTSLFCTKSV